MVVRPLSFGHATCVSLLRAQTQAFVTAAESFSEYDLLWASRCHGWSRLDAVVHVRAGLEEMVGVCAAQVDDPPYPIVDERLPPGLGQTANAVGSHDRPHAGLAAVRGRMAAEVAHVETPLPLQTPFGHAT